MPTTQSKAEIEAELAAADATHLTKMTEVVDTLALTILKLVYDATTECDPQTASIVRFNAFVAAAGTAFGNGVFSIQEPHLQQALDEMTHTMRDRIRNTRAAMIAVGVRKS